MIVPLENVKSALGIAEDDESQDETLEVKIGNAAAFIEGQVKKRFDEPVERTEYREGNGTRTLYLQGHIDTATPSASDIVVSQRFIGDRDWEVLETTEYERRDDALIMIGGVWERNIEYQLVYDDGYEEGNAPADIQALAVELVVGEVNGDASQLDDSAGITSETLVGVYSYTVSASATDYPSAVGAGYISDPGRATIERHRRRLV